MKIIFRNGNGNNQTELIPHKNDLSLLGQLDTEINSLIGLKEVKRIIRELGAYLTIQKQRREYGLKSDNLNLHMVFSGNPGVGKSTVARAIGRAFYNLEVLPQNNVVEVERADLVGEYIGHTAQKTREQIEKAQGGVLFVDEAYSLGRGGKQDFGKEAIDVLVKAMEDYREKFILILAGYYQEMECFLDLNPGLRSRFPVHIKFPDFSVKELMQIAEKMVSDGEYKLSTTARYSLQHYLTRQMRKGHLSDGNARIVRNLLERSYRKHALRLIANTYYSREDLMLLMPEDLAFAEEEDDII